MLNIDKDPEKEKQHMAAVKAWRTIRTKRIEKIKLENESIDDYNFSRDLRKVAYGEYKINPPLIKPSKLTYVEKGGIGKELSDGWALNYAVGCTHACRFCYVDSIHKRYDSKRIGKYVNRSWGDYFYTPYNIDEAIEKTKWSKWSGIEVMLSSMHDPYLPQLYETTKKIIIKALENGVKLCVQTRSTLVKKDFDIYTKYKDQVRIQVSVSTMNKDLSRFIEPRVSSPNERIDIIREAKNKGLKAGIIIAPVMPPLKIRPDVIGDMEEIIRSISDIKPDFIYGESIHARGSNIKEMESLLGEPLYINSFDKPVEKNFYLLLKKYNLKGEWWRSKHQDAFVH
jgi:DNA repair photolyase